MSILMASPVVPVPGSCARPLVSVASAFGGATLHTSVRHAFLGVPYAQTVTVPPYTSKRSYRTPPCKTSSVSTAVGIIPPSLGTAPSSSPDLTTKRLPSCKPNG
ncbi:hypothetical protein F5887DRAFT_1113126 [Amanita rubescens]|nr:hypothetical protein F5887DRAFT_1113126 [Amanita rubescens]